MDIQAALERTFSYIRTRKVNYKLCFGSPAGQQVMRDLGPFCRADAVPWGSDPYHTARLIGRQEVWLRIRQHLSLTDAQLLSIFGGKDIIVSEPAEDEDDG